MWKTLSSKEIFSHPRLTLIEDEFTSPSGYNGKYLHYKYDKNVALLVCKRADGKILLQKEYLYPIKQYGYMLPGGAVPLEEKIEEGANRELMEEAGYRAGKLELLGSYLMSSRKSPGRAYIFLATELEEESLPGDPEEDIEPEWLTEEEIETLIRNDKIIVHDILSAWTLYKLKKQQ